jgi:hypothetical protein
LRAATGQGAVRDGHQVFETPRRSEAFNAGWVEEAVLMHLVRKKQAAQAATAAAAQAAQQQALQDLLLQQQQQQQQQQAQAGAIPMQQ